MVMAALEGRRMTWFVGMMTVVVVVDRRILIDALAHGTLADTHFVS